MMLAKFGTIYSSKPIIEIAVQVAKKATMTVSQKPLDFDRCSTTNMSGKRTRKLTNFINMRSHGTLLALPTIKPHNQNTAKNAIKVGNFTFMGLCERDTTARNTITRTKGCKSKLSVRWIVR